MIISNLLTVNAQCTLYVSPCFLEVYNLKDKLRGHWVHLILLHINFFYLKKFFKDFELKVSIVCVQKKIKRNCFQWSITDKMRVSE